METDGSTETLRNGDTPPTPLTCSGEMLPSLCCIQGFAPPAPSKRCPSCSFTSHFITSAFPRPHSHSRIPEPWALLSFWLPSSEALGICFLAARGCTLIHLYHRKQKTSLTSHLFHRWESNSLLNDCPKPTIQRGRISRAAKDRGALL